MLFPRNLWTVGLIETDQPVPASLSLPSSTLRLPGAPLRVAAAFGMYLAASLLLWQWQVDDAGITFAYARNLAEGYGLVSQPGCPPVEGYSNPAWMFLCAALMKLGLFQPAASAKVLAGACVLGTLILVERLLSRTFRLGSRATLAGLALLSLNASFVVWCNSGLENSLYALLSAACLATICPGTEAGQRAAAPSLMLRAFLFGIFSAGLALTRPDGLIYCSVLPLAVALGYGIRAAIRAAVIAMIPYVALVGGYLACRLAVFHAWLPNTALMKGSGSLASLSDVLLLRKPGLMKLIDASSSLCPLDSGWVLIALVALVYGSRRIFRRSQAALAAGLFATVALTAFVLLPFDWMPHQRFATPLVVAMCVLLPVMGTELARMRAARLVTLSHPGPLPEGEGVGGRKAVAWCAVAVVLIAGVNLLHVWDFSRTHVVAFDEIQRQSEELNSLAASLGLEGRSVLAADVGGMLWNSRLRVYDLLGLTDRTVASTFNRDKPALYEYIFGQVRPTFIKVHRKLFDLARLDRDPRFAQDYVLLRGNPATESDTDEAGHLIYARKDAVADREELLQQVVK